VSVLASIPSPSSGSLHLGPLQLRAYGLCIALGAIAAVKIATERTRARGGRDGAVERIAWWAIPAGLIGSRLYHVATDWHRFRGRWFDVVKIWQGGLGIWGGIALGTIVGLVLARKEGLSLRPMMDVAAPAIPVAQAIGRFGNWFNQELFGRPTTVPWALRIDEAHRPFAYEGYGTFHPTFLYEALWCLGIAGAILLVERRVKLKAGQAFALYVALYTLGRWYFETLRIDEATQVGGFRINEIVAPTVCALAIIGFFVLGRLPQPTSILADSDGSSAAALAANGDQVAEGNGQDSPATSGADDTSSAADLATGEDQVAEGDLDDSQVRVEAEGEAAAAAAGLEELGDVDLDGREAPGLELPADAGRAARHDDGPVDDD
jgi:prolipoprotein diacylglyceryl transferase